eukprot:scaffold2222_cov164-Amphora_coffeaeformis.AAC.1
MELETTSNTTEVAELNNEAVELLGKKRVVKAANLFQKAFDRLRATSFGNETDGNTQPKYGPFSNESGPLTSSEVTAVLEYGHVHADVIQLSSTLSPHNVFRMCPFAFRLPTTAENGVDFMDENYTATILIYNLALAHYCVGVIRMQHDLILKALHLNEMAKSLFSRDSSSPTSQQQQQQFSLLQLSVEMNSGHLSFHFAQFKKTQKCHESLLASLRHVQPGQLSDPNVWMFFFAPVFHIEQFGMPTLSPQA